MGRRFVVPGSTSNLGPGFDFLGLALSLWLRVRITARAEGATHEIGELLASTAPDTSPG